MSFGYFGKLPSRSDFLTKGLPETLLGPLDDWVRQGLESVRRHLGDKWRDIYLTSPVWRFALSAGLAGPTAAAGIMVPSADRNGRDFPFIIACRADAEYGPAQLAAGLSGWLGAAAELAVMAATRALDPAVLDQRMGILGPPTLPPPLREASDWRIDGSGNPAAALPALLDHAAAAGLRQPSLWWSEGSDLVSPTSFLQNGWPTPLQFQAMLTGDWG